MATIEKYSPGQFSFAEVATTDVTRSLGFYADVLRWSDGESPRKGSGAAGGLFSNDALVAGLRKASGPRSVGWINYVTVTDIDATAERIATLGGKLVREVEDLGEAGRQAIANDPLGARFGIWQPGEHQGASVMNQPGAVCWTEYATEHSDTACEFYGGLFGWKFTETNITPRGYKTIDNAGRIIGAILQMNEDWAPGSPSQWNPYIQVDDCRASTEHALSLGSRLSEGPLDLGRTSFSIVIDPIGAPLRFMERRPKR